MAGSLSFYDEFGNIIFLRCLIYCIVPDVAMHARAALNRVC
jgi:hypothetical protein